MDRWEAALRRRFCFAKLLDARCILTANERSRRSARFAQVDGINRRGAGKYDQPWDWTRRCDDRHADSSAGSVSPRESLFSYRHDRFYRDDVSALSRVDALSRLATDTCKIYPASAGSLRDFFVNCGNVHAVCAWSASRSLGLDNAGTCLGVGHFGRIHQGDARRRAPQEICLGSLSGNGLAGPYFYPATCARRSALCGALACGRWNRLHDRCVVLRDERRALFSFCVASVRTYRHGLSFYRSAYLRSLT